MAYQPSPNVLVVDDDESLRELFVLALRELGYTVNEARDGGEAIHTIERAQARGAPFAIVLLD